MLIFPRYNYAMCGWIAVDFEGILIVKLLFYMQISSDDSYNELKHAMVTLRIKGYLEISG